MANRSDSNDNSIAEQLNGVDAVEVASGEQSVTPEAPSERVKLRYRPDIAGLRGLGVIVIVLAHANIHFLRNGFIFVDAFYVVSGFLITGLLAKEYERISAETGPKRLTIPTGKPQRLARSNQISLKNFYLRRAQRILPAALFVAWSTVLIAKFLFNATHVAAIRSDAVWATFFGANVHFMAQSTDYFQFGAETSPILHYWTLSIEEQFYAVWPVLFIFATGLPFLKLIKPYLSWRGRLTFVFGTVTFIGFIWMFISFYLSPLTTYFSTTARAWELGIGGLVALNVHIVEKFSLRVRELLSWLAVFAFTSSMVFVTSSNFGYYLWVPVFSVALFLAVGHGDQQPSVARLISAKFMQVLGLLSYSIYLWHWPVFTFARDLGYLVNWWQTSLAILLSLVLAVTTYFLIERPFHQMQRNVHRKKIWQLEGTRSKKDNVLTLGVVKSKGRPRSWRASSQSLLLALSVLMVVLILPKIAELSEKAPSIGTTAKAPHLATDLLTVSDTPISQTETDVLWQKKLEAALRLKVAPKSVVASLANLEDQKNSLFASCLDASATGGCVVGSSSARAKQAVIIGDSTALSIAPAVTGALDLKNWRIHVLTRHQCPVADVTPIIAGKPDYDCSRYRKSVFEQLARMHPDLVFMSEGSIVDTVHPTGTSPLQYWASGYAKSLSRLKQVTPKVVAIFEPPLTPTAVGCVRSNGDLRTCFGQYSEDLAFLAYTKQITATHHVHLVVLSHWLCLDGFCPAIIDNTAVKFDTTHISIDMAKKLAPLLRGDLLKAGIIESKK